MHFYRAKMGRCLEPSGCAAAAQLAKRSQEVVTAGHAAPVQSRNPPGLHVVTNSEVEAKCVLLRSSSHGLSVLDIVKHALRTIIATRSARNGFC